MGISFRGLLPSLLLAGAALLWAVVPWVAWHGAPAAQQRLVARVGVAEAPIYDDNLDNAKGRAVRGAQLQAVSRLLEELVAPEWLKLFGAELRKGILNHPETYISSYRMQRLEASVDRTRFFATLSAQVDQTRLVRDIRRMGLPVKGEPPRAIGLYHPVSDPVLAASGLREEVLEALRARLELLNLRVGGVEPVPGQQGGLWEHVLRDAPARGAFLRERRVAAGLFLEFRVEQAGGEGEATAGLYQAGNGASLGSFTVRAERLPRGRVERAGSKGRAVLSKLAEPLVARLQPRAIRPFGADSGKALPLSLRVLGIQSVEDEEAFALAFLRRDSPFGDFVLSRLDGKTVTYRGTYGGDRGALEVELPGQQFGDFVVERVYWYNDLLELELRRVRRPEYAELRLFPQELQPEAVRKTIATYLEENPEFPLQQPSFSEVEDNGWMNRANTLAFNTTAYGFIDSRGDADFYVGEELRSGEVLDISWYRVGRTNLSPVIRIYDEKGVPVRTYTPRFWIRFKYTIPEGEHAFFMEVSDRFGAMKWDAGGYLNFHYLFQIERTGEEGLPVAESGG